MRSDFILANELHANRITSVLAFMRRATTLKLRLKHVVGLRLKHVVGGLRL